MIIGLTGNKLAGKGEVVRFFTEKGFDSVSLSDIIRLECINRNLECSRKNLINVGNELRNTHGAGVLASMIIKKTLLSKDVVVDSIRNPEEVNAFRNAIKDSFLLISVDAPIEKRYERAIIRGRNENSSTLEEFIAMENLENTNNPNGQQLKKTMAMADHSFVNDGTLKELKHKIVQMAVL